MNPADINEERIRHAIPGNNRILQRADLVWSRMKLEPGEVLLIKLAAHMIPLVDEVKNVIDTVFKEDGDRVLIFFEGDMEFTKVIR